VLAKRTLPLVSFILVLFGGATAFADQATEADRARIRSCLAAQPDQLGECLFSASGPCEAEEIERAANQLQARMWCDYREMFVWREIQETTLEGLMAALPEEERMSLRAQQDDWAVRDRTACTFPYGFLQGRWRHAEAARCTLKQVQRRAVELLTYQRFLTYGEYSFQAR
jgi:hypothetical protein